MNTIAAIGVTLEEAQTSAFLDYTKQTLENAKIMAEEFVNRGYKLVAGGTENHMVVLDFSQEEFDGGEVEAVLDGIGISVSKSLIPNDPRPAFRPSGVRIGTPAMTTRGVKPEDIRQIVDFIDQAIQKRKDPELLEKLKAEVQSFALRFPLP